MMFKKLDEAESYPITSEIIRKQLNRMFISSRRFNVFGTH